MEWILISLKWLSQILIVTSGIIALFTETYKTDAATGRRVLQRAGWITIVTIVVGFVLFGFSDVQERNRAELAAQAQADQVTKFKEMSEKQTLEIGYLQNLILMQEKLAGLEVELEFPQPRLKPSLKFFDGLRDKAYF